MFEHRPARSDISKKRRFRIAAVAAMAVTLAGAGIASAVTNQNGNQVNTNGLPVLSVLAKNTTPHVIPPDVKVDANSQKCVTKNEQFLGPNSGKVFSKYYCYVFKAGGQLFAGNADNPVSTPFATLGMGIKMFACQKLFPNQANPITMNNPSPQFPQGKPNKNHWWLNTVGETFQNDAIQVATNGWGWFPATFVSQGGDEQKVPDVPECDKVPQRTPMMLPVNYPYNYNQQFINPALFNQMLNQMQLNPVQLTPAQIAALPNYANQLPLAYQQYIQNMLQEQNLGQLQLGQAQGVPCVPQAYVNQAGQYQYVCLPYQGATPNQLNTNRLYPTGAFVTG